MTPFERALAATVDVVIDLDTATPEQIDALITERYGHFCPDVSDKSVAELALLAGNMDDVPLWAASMDELERRERRAEK